ncbi:hypothetical protein EPUS_02268 [Endocarpon pusillum Z07020]|uniref:Diaminohydroxyphosphoribosylamino-pyrimidine deaminase n=1 Tax=Endocarpon pusillum (strain Z07020 / HMAS-L-300199) TaxID=1263415 RepID=U1I3U5_ENDPU|nr:uncharacterized protein EPUS_02268 [Endocarpon pusillum Z07020]ERF76729.1 hypothetical protein EPUS_02268 [Endocarpon pusillum Z07020]
MPSSSCASVQDGSRGREYTRWPEGLKTTLGDEVEDAVEETFLLFTKEIPSQSLGFVDSKAITLDIDVGKRTFMVQQSPGILHSNRAAGTTGAVLWKITPLVANWLSSTECFLWQLGWLRSDSTIVELGCGISGLIPCAMAPLLPSGVYVLTDQAYVMKLLHHNVFANQKQQSLGRSTREELQIQPFTFDWETDAASNISTLLGKDKEVDLILACDCIYNEYLIRPFVSTCASLCALRSSSSQRTVLLIAQQLRSEDVLQMWLDEMLKSFLIFRVPDRLLPEELRNGYAIHIAIVR